MVLNRAASVLTKRIAKAFQVCARTYTGASAAIHIVSEWVWKCWQGKRSTFFCHWMAAQRSPCLVPPKSNTCPPHCWRQWSWSRPGYKRTCVFNGQDQHTTCGPTCGPKARSLTLSSTISKEKSLPSPLELLQLRTLDLLVTRALMVHLDTEQTLIALNWALEASVENFDFEWEQ